MKGILCLREKVLELRGILKSLKAQSLIMHCFKFYKTKFNMNFSLYFSKKLLSKASRLKVKNFENSETYDMINRAQYEGNGRLLLFADMAGSFLSTLVTMISYLIILSRYKVWMLLIIMIIPVLKFGISKSINYKRFYILCERTNDVRKVKYIQNLIMNIPYDSYHESQITIPVIRGNRTINTLFRSTCKVAAA